jgi:hypothetical protein
MHLFNGRKCRGLGSFCNFAVPSRDFGVCCNVGGVVMGEITVQEENQNRSDDPEWRASFAALKMSLRSKRGSDYRVGTIAEDDKYDNETA